MSASRFLIEHLEAAMAVNTFQLETCRMLYARFKQLLAKGDRDDPATMIAIVEVSGFLAEAIPYLLDEIERLQAKRPAEPGHVLKMDSQSGVA